VLEKHPTLNSTRPPTRLICRLSDGQQHQDVPYPIDTRLILTLRTKRRRGFTPSISLRLPPPPCTGEAGRGFAPHRSALTFSRLERNAQFNGSTNKVPTRGAGGQSPQPHPRPPLQPSQRQALSLQYPRRSSASVSWPGKRFSLAHSPRPAAQGRRPPDFPSMAGVRHTVCLTPRPSLRARRGEVRAQEVPSPCLERGFMGQVNTIACPAREDGRSDPSPPDGQSLSRVRSTRHWPL
jgi:hypothetical protein